MKCWNCGGEELLPADGEALVCADCGECANENDLIACDKHGPQTVVEEGSYTGFAGGLCFDAKLSCGCWTTDESNDVRAAM